MMKWMMILPLALLLTACGFTNGQTMEYQQVLVTPPSQHISVVADQPVDVTTTTLDYF